MSALDTNVLVRYLTQDEPKQAAIATEEIEQVAAKDEKILIQPSNHSQRPPAQGGTAYANLPLDHAILAGGDPSR